MKTGNGGMEQLKSKKIIKIAALNWQAVFCLDGHMAFTGGFEEDSGDVDISR